MAELPRQVNRLAVLFVVFAVGSEIGRYRLALKAILAVTSDSAMADARRAADIAKEALDG